MTQVRNDAKYINRQSIDHYYYLIRRWRYKWDILNRL
jgi:hypothetical protein